MTRPTYNLALNTLLALNDLSSPTTPVVALLRASGYLWLERTVAPLTLVYTLNDGAPVQVTVTRLELIGQELVLHPTGTALSLGGISYLLLPHGQSYRRAPQPDPEPDEPPGGAEP